MNTDKPKCPERGHEMSLREAPHIWRRKIPLTNIEIELIRWAEEYYCPWCENEEQNALIERIAESAENYGYQLGWRDAMEEEQ